MNKLDDLSFKIFVDFLEIQEYIKMFVISKYIHDKALVYKEIRYPYVVVYNAIGPFEITEVYFTDMKNNSHTAINGDYEDECRDTKYRDYKPFVQAVLKIGKIGATRLIKYSLIAYPQMLKDIIEIKMISSVSNCEGREYPCTNIDHYCVRLLNKYNIILNSIIDENEKRRNESLFFRKLTDKYNFVKNYLPIGDTHMNRFNARLNLIINK